MSNRDFQEMDCYVLHTTPEAAKCDFGLDGEREVWVPFSTMEDQSIEQAQSAKPDDMLQLEIAEWFLVEKGIV